MNLIAQNIAELKAELPAQVKLVAVSKTKPLSAIEEAYASGQRIFGENKVQELVTKYEGLPKDIEWHMIGHLQSNKVKYIAPFVSLIHGVDSLSLLKEIDKQGKKCNRKVPVLLQFHIAEEETKFGFSMDEVVSLFSTDLIQNFNHVQISGVMGMATFTENNSQIKKEFDQLKKYFDQLKSTYFLKDEAFKEISMGMSGDYKLAIEAGSTMVRIGSTIFGSR